MKDQSLQELRFQLRAFLNYSDYLDRLKNQGVIHVDYELPIDLEITRTVSRIEDLSILIRRKSIEEGETPRKSK